MDGTPYFIFGLMIGVSMTLMIQFLANRRIRKQLLEAAQAVPATPSEEQRLHQRETVEMHRRLAVLEQIVTEEPRRLASEIERLR